MKSDCKYKLNESECYRVGSQEIQVGTMNKISMIEKFVEAWINKICLSNMGYKGLMFIDAMSNSGTYYNNEHQMINGTTVRVANLFEKYARGKYKNYTFEIVVNDIDAKAIECQKCRLGEIVQKVQVSYHQEDVKVFLTHFNERLEKYRNVHILLFYDPFNTNIHWNELSEIVKKIYSNKNVGIDLIFSHFHQHDISRGLQTVKKSTAIERYERTYQLSINKLKILTKDLIRGSELSDFFRKQILIIIKNALNVSEGEIAYAPVFNSKNLAVYDIVFISKSIRAKVLFKQTMYKLEKDDYEPTDQLAFVSLFDDNSYQSSREEYTERNIFYSSFCYAKEIANIFHNKSLTLYELKSFLDYHMYIPSDGAINDIKRNLKKNFDVELPSKTNNWSYVFPEIKDINIK